MEQRMVVFTKAITLVQTGAGLCYFATMDAVTLPPELEQFAAEAIAAGRFRDSAEIVAAGLSLLRTRETAREALLSSVLQARAEAERDGYLTGDDVLARVEARLAGKQAANG